MTVFMIIKQFGRLVIMERKNFDLYSLECFFLFTDFFLGVEFFDEKLNSLCMTWLIDHVFAIRKSN